MPPLPKIAVVGLGNFGTLHAESLKGLEGAVLAAVVEPDTCRREGVARALSVPAAFASLEDLIAARAADAVIIATRSDSHVPLSIRAMEAGLHLLLEKPAAENEKDLQRLIAHHQEQGHGQVAMVNHICLFHSLVAPLIRRIGKTGFRAIQFVRHRPATLTCRFPEAHPLRLLMIHDLYIAARMVAGEEPSECSYRESRGPGGVVDMTWLSLGWPDGRTATFQSHCTLPPSAPRDGWDSIEVFGDEFYSLVETNPAPWLWQENKLEWPVALEISNVDGRSTGMLAEAQRSFVNAIHGAPVMDGCRLEDALRVERWIGHIEQATPFDRRPI